MSDEMNKDEWISREQALELLGWQLPTFTVACSNYRKVVDMPQIKMDGLWWYKKADIEKLLAKSKK